MPYGKYLLVITVNIYMYVDFSEVCGVLKRLINITLRGTRKTRVDVDQTQLQCIHSVADSGPILMCLMCKSLLKFYWGLTDHKNSLVIRFALVCMHQTNAVN